MRLHALRGAISVERDERDAILAATTELMHELVARNALRVEDVVSCIFTATPDLTATFPAAAARAMGFELVPLMCATEIAVPGALPRIVRVLVHHYAPEGHRAEHVYLRDAVALRTDLASAQ